MILAARKRFRTLLLAALLAAPGAAPLAAAPADPAPLSPAQFERTGAAAGPFCAGQYYKIELSAEALSACRPGLPDLRLLAPGGAECRYVIVEHRLPGEAPRAYPLELEAFDPATDAVTLVAKIPKEADPLEALDLSIPEGDFRKRVTVEAESGGAWSVVASGVVYDFRSQVDLRETTVKLPGVRGERLRVTLRDDDPGVPGEAGAGSEISLKFDGLDFSATRTARKRVRVDGLTARAGLRREGEILYDERTIPAPALAKEKAGESSFTVPLGLPVDELAFAIDSGEFVRGVRVLAGKTADGPFTQVAGGSLSNVNLSGERQLRDLLRLSERKIDHLKVVFEDRSSPPLAVRSLTARHVRRVLLFVPDADAPGLTLCAGHPDLPAPAYDLASIVHQGNWHTGRAYLDVPMPALAANAKVERPVPGDVQARMEKGLLAAIILLLVAGLGFWFYKVIQSVPPPPEAPAGS